MSTRSTITIPIKYWNNIGPNQVKCIEDFKRDNPPEQFALLVEDLPWIKDLVDPQRVDISDVISYWDHASDVHTHSIETDFYSLYDRDYAKHVREYVHRRDDLDWSITLSQTIQGILDPDATFKLRLKPVVLPVSLDDCVYEIAAHYWILSLETTTSEDNAILIKLSM